MKRIYIVLVLTASSLALVLNNCTRTQLTFESMPKIDAHLHFRVSGPEVMKHAVATKFKVVNIVVDSRPIEPQKNSF